MGVWQLDNLLRPVVGDHVVFVVGVQEEVVGEACLGWFTEHRRVVSSDGVVIIDAVFIVALCDAHLYGKQTDM